MKSVFQRPLWVAVFGLTAAMLWGWAYPLIKLGFTEFGIEGNMTGSKMLFAGIRFTLSGLILLLIASITGRKLRLKEEGRGHAALAWLYILVFALFNTTFHYATFYVGLSHSEGSRAAILNSLSVFLVVILACLFFKSDRMSLRKLLGCLIGFAGILALNLGSGASALGGFSLMGDGMIILNAICSAVASLMTRGLGKRIDIFVGTGVSLALGGLLLVVPGLLMGGTIPAVTARGVFYLICLICISSTGFSLYNKLISLNPVGKVAIFNSLIPIIGALTSCWCLGELFHWNYLVAGTLAALGIYIINRTK